MSALHRVQCAGAPVRQRPQWMRWACICTFLHMHVAFMFVRTRASAYRCLPAGDTWLRRRHFRCVLRASLQAGSRGETLSAAHPGEEGLPARLLSHHLGPCACDCPAPDPLGSSRCRRTSALCNLLVKREKQHATDPAHLLFAMRLHSHTVPV